METNIKPAKHLYGRGWLGLIPLVGGITGIVLILLGVFKYRDRKLIIIGVTALLFTVLVYSSINYYFNYSTEAKNDFAVFTQPAMDNLIKEIEFYKVDQGDYPDSLMQIVNDDKFASIYDPIPGGSDKNNRQFYYKKINSKYYLFSAGVDKIPFTSDDIYPSLKYYDSTKTGLVHPLE